MDIPPLSQRVVIESGRWNERYARVLAPASEGSLGYALVDGNGDRAEVEMEEWVYRGDAWEPCASIGIGSLNVNHSVHWIASTDPDPQNDATVLMTIFGVAPGFSHVNVLVDGTTYGVVVGESGVWGVIARASGRDEAEIDVSGGRRRDE